MGVLVVILVAAVVVAGLWYSYYRKKQREQALATFAGQHGLEYSKSDPYGLLSHGFHLFRQGDGRGCEEVLAGTWQGLPVKEADYWYYTQSTDSEGRTSRSYKYFSVIIADLQAAMPYVSVSKESVFSRLADHLGFHDIDFESEQFNREFQVKSPDREFAFKLIDARMIQWLLSTGGTFGFEAQGPNVLVYCHRLKPVGLLPIFGAAKAFQDHVPNLVWTEYGQGVAPPTQEAPSTSSGAGTLPPPPSEPEPAVPPPPAVPPTERSTS